MRWPLLGDMLDLYKDVTGTFARIASERGERAPLYLGPSRALLISNPEDAKRLLLAPESQARKSRYTKMMGMVFGDSVLLAEGEDWRRQRDYLNPLLSPKAIKAHVSIIIEETQNTVGRANTGAEAGEEFEAVLECRLLVQRITGRILFGDLFPREKVEAVTKHLQTVNDGLFGEFIRKSVLRGPLALLPAPNARKLRTAVAAIGSFIDELLRLQIAADHPSLAAAIVRAVPEGPRRSQEIKDQITVLFYAGQDTTARALAWTLYFLSDNQKWITAIRDEARGSDIDDSPAIELKALPITLAVIRESMRLRPVAYAIDREFAEDDLLECPAAKKGVIAPIAVSNVHRNAAHWPDADRFDPSRFLGDAVAGRHPCAYIPFGHGRRKCIGASLAELEMTLIVSHICRSFDFIRAHTGEVRAKAAVTLAPHPEVRLRMRPLPP